jgi:hypothetical protein
MQVGGATVGLAVMGWEANSSHYRAFWGRFATLFEEKYGQWRVVSGATT